MKGLKKLTAAKNEKSAKRLGNKKIWKQKNDKTIEREERVWLKERERVRKSQ